MLTNKDGSDIGQFLYTPFGEMWVEEASTVDISHITRFFTNQQYDKESGLYYYNARYYDPHLGSFLTPDPAMANLNHYSYCSANPIKYSDPTGLTEEYSPYNTSGTGANTPSTPTNDDPDDIKTQNENLESAMAEMDENRASKEALHLSLITISDPVYKSIVADNTKVEYKPDFSKLPVPPEKVLPTIFTQNQFDNMFNFGSGANNKACCLTELINAISKEYTKITNIQMTIDQAKQMIIDGHEKKDANGNRYVRDDATMKGWSNFLNNAWKETLDMDGKYKDTKSWAVWDKGPNDRGNHGIYQFTGTTTPFHWKGDGAAQGFYHDPYTGLENNSSSGLFKSYYIGLR